MANKQSKMQPKIAIVAIIFLLLGIVIALSYILLNGGSVSTIKQEIVQKSQDKKKNEKQYAKKNHKNFNFYYSATGKKYRPKNNYKDSFQNQNPRTFIRKTIEQEKTLMLDLNTADSTDFMLIKGMKPYFARRIVRYRELLGGYVSISQLREVYGMNDYMYNNLSRNCQILSNNIRKISINSLDAKTLAKHPYIDYPLAYQIINFHKKHGEYSSLKELYGIPTMDSTQFNKIQPYLSI